MHEQRVALQASDVSYSPGPRFSLREVSLSIATDRLTVLVGPNGSGKTTLIKILCGLIVPDNGEIGLLGKPLFGYDHMSRARHLAYVSQTWRPAFDFSVEQTVLIGRTPHKSLYGGFEDDRDLAAAEEAIELMDLTSLRREPVTRLSGGELQRVLIAMAIAQETDVLVLDEPTTHLDVAYQIGTLEKIRMLMERRRVAVLASIHDLNLASIFGDTVAMMSAGTVIATGDPSDVLTAERIRQAFAIDLDVVPQQYGNAPSFRFRPSHPRSTDIRS